MHPILLKLGPVTVYSYGVMVAIGFGLATLLIYRRAAKFHLHEEMIMDLAILILIAGVLGARTLYIAFNLNYYISNPYEILNLAKGGLVWYGGFLAALVVVLVYIKRKKLSFWEVTDLIAPYLALAQGFGRIGCFLNGCCYGLPGHPVQIYSSLALFVIFLILRLWQDKRHFIGEIFLGYCILYSSKRFAIEFLRADNPKVIFALTFSQIVSAVIFSISIIVFIYKMAQWKKRPISSG